MVSFWNYDDRLYIILYLSLLCFSSFVFLRPASSSILVGYILLFAIYIVPFVYSFNRRVDERIFFTFLLLVPVFTFLIVIDPVEAGLFGHDPYTFTLPAHNLMLQSPKVSEFLKTTDSWPGFYYITSFIQNVTGLSVITMGKYIPLIAASLPILLYTGVRNVMSLRDALRVSIAFSSTRTLLLFETKFVDEPAALVSFFVLLFFTNKLLTTENMTISQLRVKLVIILISISIVLTHHAIGLMLILFLISSRVVLRITSIRNIPERFKLGSESWSFPISFGVIAVVSFILTFVYGATNLTIKLVPSFIASVSAGSGGEVAGPSTGGSFRNVIASSATVVIGLLCLICAYGFLSKSKIKPWATTWITFGGIIGLLYIISLLLGTFISLDPIRFLIILTPVLLASATYVMRGLPLSDTTVNGSIFIQILLVLFIITQISAIGPGILYSDTTETTLGEGHYTPAQFEASSWVAEYGGGRIIGYEEGLWKSRDENIYFRHNFTYDGCDEWLNVYRAESNEKFPFLGDIVYDSSKISLYYC